MRKRPFLAQRRKSVYTDRSRGVKCGKTGGRGGSRGSTDQAGFVRPAGRRKAFASESLGLDKQDKRKAFLFIFISVLRDNGSKYLDDLNESNVGRMVGKKD